VAEEVTDNRFTIKTDKPNVRVSWQITGIRQDAWANAHRIEVDVEKSEGQRGKYLAAKEHGQPGARLIQAEVGRNSRVSGLMCGLRIDRRWVNGCASGGRSRTLLLGPGTGHCRCR
jgi:hypothetical protein